MTSNKPYLIRALYEWLVDNDATPYIMVDTTVPGVMIPPGIDNDGQVVLNIAMRAVQGLDLANDHITFSARFGGVNHHLYLPMRAVMAIYSKEDGQGMMFSEDTSATADAPASDVEQPAASIAPAPSLEEDGVDKPAADTSASTSGKKFPPKKPGLTIVK